MFNTAQQTQHTHLKIDKPNQAIRHVGYLLFKRTIDAVIAFIALMALSPIIIIAAIAIRLDSPGPALFHQKRVGARWRIEEGQVVWTPAEFSVFKFRSMSANSDSKIHEEHVRAFYKGAISLDDHDHGAPAKIKSDSRVTRVGALLRKTSLDEIPQFFNVLRGEMSIVGPRPVPPYEVEMYEDWHRERLNALPGITGLWQIKGRGRVSADDAIRMDIAYVRQPNLLSDAWIIIATIPALVFGQGAS